MHRLIVVVLLVGCGGDDGGSNGSIVLDNLGMELGIASCGAQFECCTEAEIMEQYMGLTFEGQPITTEEQCVAFTTAVFTSFAVDGYKASIELGRMAYDGEAAAACVAAIERLSCTQYSTGMAPACASFVIPMVADGGACTQDHECTSDNCEGASTPLGGPNTDGACKPMPTAGQPCENSCADGLYCGFDQTSSMDVCQPPQADGADCNSDGECASDHCDDAIGTCAPRPLTCDGR